MYKLFPGISWETESGECSDYDPRIRPWYIGASSGSKNVIFIIDSSGSMAEQKPTRIEIAKTAANKTIGGLNVYDWVGLVFFETK